MPSPAHLTPAATAPALSILIPVYNEEGVLDALFARLYPVLDAMGEPYEIIFINDGSRDRSVPMLREQFQRRPDVTRVVLFNGNFGQHMALMAGFEHARGEITITLDADLQNPPEEIPRLVAAIREGHDYVGTVRRQRHDTAFRRVSSRLMNRLRERITRIEMTDQGCMLRAYDRALVDTLNACQEVNTFVPALAYTFAASPTEIEVSHEERHAGESKYSIYKLLRLNFDLVTGFSIVPLQWFSLLGTALSAASGSLFLLLVIRRFLFGAEVEGVFTLFALLFFLVGIVLFGIGLMGEYVGRIQQEVRRRPRYRVSAVLQAAPDSGPVFTDGARAAAPADTAGALGASAVAGAKEITS
ncbi:glycosyltransferase [Roseateles chitosanitabidus]|uniref:glycosyltransferase n=1 Tax=Roseateles chitosanitabidus TaxID=65048 RepID=UPI00082D5EE5|nr:glycosyltransferase [Roseateles chitosanitabidus]